jgi:hypothetical protein
MLFRNNNKKQDLPGDDYVEDGRPGDIKSFAKAQQSDGIPALLQIFALDLRSLALFRVMLGIMIVVDLVGRSSNMFAHYANLGVWPVVEAINNINPHSFSFHFSNGNISLTTQ